MTIIQNPKYRDGKLGIVAVQFVYNIIDMCTLDLGAVDK